MLIGLIEINNFLNKKVLTYFLKIILIFNVKQVSSYTIHVFGDSHGYHCFNNSESLITQNEVSSFVYSDGKEERIIDFSIYWLGGKTMFAIGRDGLHYLNIKKYNVKNNDAAVFVFGEVDVRCHIGKQRDQNKRDLKEIIHSLALNYIATIKKNRDFYDNLTCVIMSVIPPTDNGYNSAMPYYGSLQERVELTCILNQTLKKYAEENGILFLDISPFFSKNDGSLNESLSDNIVHIHPKYNKIIKDKLIVLLSVNFLISTK